MAVRSTSASMAGVAKTPKEPLPKWVALISGVTANSLTCLAPRGMVGMETSRRPGQRAGAGSRILPRADPVGQLGTLNLGAGTSSMGAAHYSLGEGLAIAGAPIRKVPEV
jgi:hypothetical protein